MVLLNYICTLFITMRNTKEYSIKKLQVGNSLFYFIGNDFIVVGTNLISCRRRKIADFTDDFNDFRRRLDFIADNNLTITL